MFIRKLICVKNFIVVVFLLHPLVMLSWTRTGVWLKCPSKYLIFSKLLPSPFCMTSMLLASLAAWASMAILFTISLATERFLTWYWRWGRCGISWHSSPLLSPQSLPRDHRQPWKSSEQSQLSPPCILWCIRSLIHQKFLTYKDTDTYKKDTRKFLTIFTNTKI